MKKKVLFLTLAAALMLTACGGDAESTEAETSVEAEAEETETEAEETETEAETEVEAEAEDKAETEAEAEAETEAEAEEAVAGEYAKGLVTETGWESEWLGIRYTLPEGMTMSSDEELNEMMGLGQEVLSEDFSELQLKYAEMASVYEMMSKDELGVTNVIVLSEKLPMSLTAEEYVEVLTQQLAQVSTVQYEVTGDTETVTIGATDFVKLSTEADYDGVKMYQEYYVTVRDDRAATITLTYIDQTAETAEAVRNGFGAY